MNKKSIALLALIGAAMQNTAAPYHMASPKEASELLESGLVEQNPEIAEGDKIATRLTEKGQNELTGSTNTGGANAPATNTAAASAFAIEDNVPVPAARGGKGGSVYPFDALAVNQSFFVPATTDRPNPAKSLASTVSSASARYATETGKKTITRKGKSIEVAVLAYDRQFTVRSVEGGARVWRTK